MASISGGPSAATATAAAAAAAAAAAGPASAFESPTFQQDVSIYVEGGDVGAASISPSGRDVVLASKLGLNIIDLDNPYSPPRFISNRSSWDVADVQWSPFASRPEWIASTCNQLALVYNLAMAHNVNKAPIQYTLRTHERAITDINFAAHHPDFLATCGVDSFVFVHDLRAERPALKLADFVAGATQVKWNRQDSKIIASSHDKYLHIWDLRRGAHPLTTIEAHSTKIYGIDWNRSEPTKIMTCSLDYTIKLWDKVGVQSRITTPTRVIRTHYPVWRARHTPFPEGILAMPQRGNSSLWLYNNSKDINNETPNANSPVHDFKRHDADQHVREFLWRTRGSTDDGIDNREFQLVSWGTDKRLHLHKISPELLANTVGFHKGDPVVGEPSTTRKGAAYLTYRDGPVTPTATAREELDAPRAQRKGNLSTLLQNSSLNDEIFSTRYRGEAQPRTQPEPLPRATMTATPIRRSAPRVVGHITWMDGVKFAERQRDGQDDNSKQGDEDHDEKYRSQSGHDLATEIAYVGNKYRKLNFEVVDIPGRRVTVSFNGPWGDYDVETSQLKLVFLRLTIKFPPGYPKAMENNHSSIPLPRINTPLDIEFERTTATVGKGLMATLTEDIEHIARVYAHQEREALEAVLSFALGERGFQDSLKLTQDDQPPEEGPMLEGESSSEDDDNEGEFNDEAMQSSHTNANIPRPVQTSARFSVNGALVLSRILVTRPAPLSSAQIRLPRFLRNGPSKDDIFETFGRFATRDNDSEGGSSPSSSIGSWEMSTSPSSGSESDQGANGRIGAFQPPLAWQKATTRFQTRSSIPSSIGAAKPIKDRSILSVLSSAVEELIPSKRVLAEEYLIFGPGPEVCLHNSEVARRHGYEDLADIWILCKLILSNDVPLEILPQQLRREQVLVLARRALVRIKKKDSGLDLQFDAKESVTNPKLRGRIKWGHHAVVTWLIPALFDHFEHLADVQMLAMLSCIFSEPAAREGVPSAMAKMRQSHLPMSMEAPAFSLDYFSSAEAAWSLFKPTISVPSTPAHSRYATPQNEFGWHRLTKTLDTYGSHGSSNGPWGSDTIPSEPVTPYSTGNTPPILSRTPTVRSVATASHTPYSTSPEQSQAGKRLTGTNFASAVAALSRPFSNAMSSSPPVKSRVDDLSTSAPTGGVTWGTTTFYGSGSGSQERSLGASRIKHGKRASFGQSDRLNVDYHSDSESEHDDGTVLDGASEYATTPLSRDNEEDDGGMIRVTLKNQDQFDDEACVSAPLLNMSKDWLYRSWREQYAELLGCWGLISERAEVLKFNGLVSYFPQEGSRSGSKAGSVVLALRKEGEGTSDRASRALSRASTLAPPPSIAPNSIKRSPAASPRHFSFNPEALEFTPGNSFSPAEELAPPPDVFISSEQYLRLSIPSPLNEESENLPPVSAIGEVLNDAKLHPLSNRSLRPSISRATSQVSNSSIGRRSSAGRKDKKEPIYSCSICWIRVSGRFYLCPGCGHVAHFDCMDDELGMDESECIVGCGCGCGLEEEDERSRMEAYIDEVRAWEETGGWMADVQHGDEPLATPSSAAYEGVYGEEAGDSWVGVEKFPQQKAVEKRSVAGSIAEKPRKEKSKPKRKARVSGKSYY